MGRIEFARRRIMLHSMAASMAAPNDALNGRPATRFVEVQRFRQWWMIAIIAGASGLVWYCFVVQILLGQPVGTKPASDAAVWVLTALIGVGFPLFFASISMRTVVDADGVTIRFFPVWTRRIRLADIASAAAVTYHPIMDYGGWGIRWSFAGWCYNVSGNRGVKVTLADGSQVMIGSGRAEELAASIDGMRSATLPA